MKEILIVSTSAIIFLLIGLACLVWPEKIQQFGLNYYSRHEMIAKYNPFLGWMKTHSYILSLRIIGTLAMGVFVLLLFIMIKKGQGVSP
jgi:hypothetical protein